MGELRAKSLPTEAEREVAHKSLQNNVDHVFLGRGRGAVAPVIVFVSCALHLMESLGKAEWCAKRS